MDQTEETRMIGVGATEDESEGALDSIKPEGVGAHLRRAREAKGLSAREVADCLRLRLRQIEAMEQDQPELLPGGIYTLGFVRSYGNFLGIETDSLVARARLAWEDEVAPPPVKDGAPKENKVSPPWRPLLIFSTIGAAVLLLGWYGYERFFVLEAVSRWPALFSDGNEGAGEEGREGTPKTLPEETPDRLEAGRRAGRDAQADADQARSRNDSGEAAKKAEPGEAASLAGSSEPSQAPSDTGGAGDVSREGEAGPTIADADSVADEPLAEAVAPQPGLITGTSPIHFFGADAPALETPARVLLRANGESWVEITEYETDRKVWTGILRPGQRLAILDSEGLRLRTGNAGALAIFIDRVSMPALGPSGAVRSNVTLNPELLRRRLLTVNRNVPAAPASVAPAVVPAPAQDQDAPPTRIIGGETDENGQLNDLPTSITLPSSISPPPLIGSETERFLPDVAGGDE